MSNQRPRIVLVGAGGYGRLYVEAMAQRDYGADLAAICLLGRHHRYVPKSAYCLYPQVSY